ncbi:norbelladine synthase-like [Cornus florida]|uniref:norbelladine synthase-like n=1 Tax=Cornus florida TaxID=4283 RepID=UPI00289FBCAF|nr:norbelladine synthase-like [Cornus florida]
MFGTVSEEMEVQVPASEAWKLYSTHSLIKFVEEKLSNVIHKIEILEGDGGAGSILKVSLPPGSGGFASYKEKLTKCDDEKRLKEAEVIEGAFLDVGFTLYRVRFEVIEKSESSCITKYTIEYEVKEEAAANASMVSVQPLVTIMGVAADHLIKNKK